MNLFNKNILEEYTKKTHESQQDFNFEKIKEMKSTFESDIEANAAHIENRRALVLQIARVFEHSVNDGIQLGKQYKLTPEEWSTIATHKSNALKHRGFYNKLKKKINSVIHNPNISDIYVDKYKSIVDKMSDILSLDEIELAHSVENSDIYKNKDIKNIDSYYAKVLSLSGREFKPISQNKKENFLGTTADKKAKEYLEKLSPFLEGLYFNGDLHDVLFNDFIKNDKEVFKKIADDFSRKKLSDRKRKEKIINEYLSYKKIDEDVLIVLSHFSHIPNNIIEKIKPFLSEEGISSMEKTRYKKLDVVYNTERNIVEKPLLEETKEFVRMKKGNDFSIKLIDGKYEIFDTKEEERKITERDEIEFGLMMDDYDNAFKQARQEIGSDFDPRARGQNKLLNTLLDKIEDKIDENNYIKERAELILPMDVTKLIFRMSTNDDTKFALLDIDKYNYIKAGKYSFLKSEIEKLQGISDKYIKEVLKEIDLLQEKYTQESKKEKIIYDLEKKHIKRINNTLEINGKLAFIAQLENNRSIVVQDGKQIGGEYKFAGSLVKINEKLAFEVQLKDGNYFITHDGKQIGGEYKDVGNLIEINGKLAFTAQLENDNRVIVYDGKQIGGEYKFVRDPVEINGKPAFKVLLENNCWVIYHDGKQISGEYKHLGNPVEINGKPAFRAKLENDRYVIYHDGKQISGEYKHLGNPVEINGKPAFKVLLENNCWVIYHDGKQISGEYKHLGNPVEINGKPSFHVGLDNNYQAIIHDGKQIGGEYEDIYDLVEINGKLASLVRLNYKYFIIYDGKQIGGEYKEIYNFFERKGMLILNIREDNKIKEISIPLDENYTELDEKLELLNTVHKPEIKKIKKILPEVKEKKLKDILKDQIQSSFIFAKSMTDFIKTAPKEFLSLNSVKKTRAENKSIKELARLMIPDVYAEISKNKRERAFSFNMKGKLNSMSYLSGNKESIGYQGGNPNESIEGKSEVIISARYPLQQSYIVQNLYAGENNGIWSKIYIPLDTDPEGFSRENTLTTGLVDAGSKVQLPLPAYSSFIEKRVKGVTRDGIEIQVKLEKDSFGAAYVTVPDKVEHIIYSVQESMVNETPNNVSDLEFEKTKKQILLNESGKAYFEKISGLNEQEKMFIKSIESLSVKEKVIAIEKYAKEISYYDFDNNDEVVKDKRSANTEDLFYLMEERMLDLRAQNPDKDYAKKRYAGVCDDFSKLTTALLREAGIPSGVMTGFRSDGNPREVKLSSAHGMSFVLWRGNNGNIKSYIVDGTPEGMNEEERKKQVELGIIPESIEEKEKENKEILKEILEQSEKEIKEIEVMLGNMDVDKIKTLENGKLENALNMILAHDVEWSHVQALEAIFNAYRFTPLYGISPENKYSKELASNFLDGEMKKINNLDEYIIKHKGSAGSALFNILNEYILREEKNKKDGIADVSHIYSLIESNLTKQERRSINVVLQYLKAKKMISSKKN